MMIKICILTSVHPPFDTRIFHKEAKSLVKAGYDVTLIAQHDNNKIVDGIKIIALPKPKNRFQRMFGLTLKVLYLSLKQNADVYHFHDPELLPVGVLLKLFTGRKVIYDVHEHYPNSILGKYWIPIFLRKIIKKLFEFQEYIFLPFIDYVIYTTPIVGGRYQRMKIKTERIENLASLDIFKDIPNSQNKYKHDEQYLVYIGGMTEIRGIEEIIKAFSITSKKYPRLKLYLIGSVTPESFKGKLNNLILDLRMNEKVRIISPVPYVKIKEYLANAMVGIVTYLPYPNNKSCLPNKLFEYMACGLPVIASDFPLYREIVNEVNFGKLVNPEDTQEISKAMEDLLKNPKELKKMSNNARRAFENKYNWSYEAKKLIYVYNFLMNKYH